MSEISRETLNEGGQLLTSALLTYIQDINQGYNKCDKDFSIALTLKIKPGHSNGNFELEAGINFTKDKIKDTFTRIVDQAQGSLFDEEGTGEQVKCPNRDELVYSSYCNNKCELRCVATLSEPNEKGEQLEQGLSCAAWADKDHQDWLEAFLQDCEMWSEDHSFDETDQEAARRARADRKVEKPAKSGKKRKAA